MSLFICLTSSIRKARTILHKLRNKKIILVSDLSVSKFATIRSGHSSLGDGELSHAGVSQSGDASEGLASISLQVLDSQLAT